MDPGLAISVTVELISSEDRARRHAATSPPPSWGQPNFLLSSTRKVPGSVGVP